MIINPDDMFEAPAPTCPNCDNNYSRFIDFVFDDDKPEELLELHECKVCGTQFTVSLDIPF